MYEVARFKVILFVTYSIIQDIISSEMYIRTGPLNGQCKKIKLKMKHNKRIYINKGKNKIKIRKQIRGKMCNEITCAIQYTVDLINNNINRDVQEECANSKKNV